MSKDLLQRGTVKARRRKRTKQKIVYRNCILNIREIQFSALHSGKLYKSYQSGGGSDVWERFMPPCHYFANFCHRNMDFVSAFFALASVFVALGQEFRCPDKTGYFPDPYQCDLYYECSRGVPEAKLCPDGLVFKDGDPNRERCDIPANVDCGDRTELQEAHPSPGCPRANGYFRHPDPQICDKFYSCVNGQHHELPCPPGLIYDDIGSTCAWPQDSKRTDCSNGKRDTLSDGFSCPTEAVLGQDGRPLPHPTFPHPTDCVKFYICRNGVVPQRGSCSGGTVYNKGTLMCDEPENVPECRDWFSNKKS